MRLELLKGANGMCISLNNTRITDPKIYGILAPIMVWDVPEERIQKILDEREPVRHGHWEPIGARLRGGITDTFQCSDCEYLARALKAGKECGYDFCPNCGARMEG